MDTVTVVFVDNNEQCIQDQQLTFYRILDHYISDEVYKQKLEECGLKLDVDFSLSKKTNPESTAEDIIIESKTQKIIFTTETKELELPSIKDIAPNKLPKFDDLTSDEQDTINKLCNDLYKKWDSYSANNSSKILWAVDLCLSSSNKIPTGKYLADVFHTKKKSHVLIYTGVEDFIRETENEGLPIYHRAVQVNNLLNNSAPRATEINVSSELNKIEDSPFLNVIKSLLLNSICNINFLGEILYETQLLIP